MQEILKNKAIELLENNTVERVIGWSAGEFCYDITPNLFSTVDEVKNGFVYTEFCGANLSKYLVAQTKKPGGKILVFLKPCDAFSFSQLLTEHRIKREQVYVVAIPCYGKADIDKIKAKGINGVTAIAPSADRENLIVSTIYGDETVKLDDVLLEKCKACKSKKHPAIYDELLFEEGEKVENCNRFDEVARIEAMTPDERFEFFRGELSRCIRCNACRNVCPACTCEKCVFDNPDSGVENKAAANSFEENMFHIIRAFHVAGRCTDCGECSRVCPQHIPLHLLNRKFIKDINELYGEYQAGETTGTRSPLNNFTKDDCEPSVVHERGGDK